MAFSVDPKAKKCFLDIIFKPEADIHLKKKPVSVAQTYFFLFMKEILKINGDNPVFYLIDYPVVEAIFRVATDFVLKIAIKSTPGPNG